MLPTNNSNSLFSNFSKPLNDQDEVMETKFQNRQNAFTSEENFSELKENELNKELSLGQNVRDKIFMQKRIKMLKNSEQSQSLKNKLTISLQLYENCEKMVVDLSKFKDIIEAFRTQNIEQKYQGLVGIRKLLALNPSPIQELIDIGTVPELLSL